MKVAYDISVLGEAYYHSASRTGVFRVVENIAYGLATAKECDLSFCISRSLETLNQSLEYLRFNSKFDNVPLVYKEVEERILNSFLHLINLTNEKTEPGLLLKAIQKSLYYANKIIESNIQLLDSKILDKQDIFHSPFYPIPEHLNKKNRLKFFLTVYDLIPVLFPQYFNFSENHVVKDALNRLTPENWIICISNATKNDLCDYIKHIEPSKAFVAHLAASELFYLCSDLERVAMIKRKYSIPPDEPYILSLSTLEPRKNISHTIRCFAKLVSQQHIKDLYLVLVGTKGWNYNNIFEEISNYPSLRDRIIVTGYVADEDLAPLYSAAMAFVYPSFYEGFGLPPLEAMQCGVPVITSNTSSLPEVVGDAGIMVSPTDADALCQSMLEIYNNPSLRKAMSLSSIERSRQFSWEKCTQETINAYKTALSS